MCSTLDLLDSFISPDVAEHLSMERPNENFSVGSRVLLVFSSTHRSACTHTHGSQQCRLSVLTDGCLIDQHP